MGEMNMRRLLPLLTVLLLSACFDAETVVEFLDAETAEITTTMTVDAETAAAMKESGDNMCEDGVASEMADGSYACAVSARFAVTDLIVRDETLSEKERELVEGMSVARMEAGVFRITFDLSEFSGENTDPDSEEARRYAAMFAGHSYTMRVTGAEIISTSGEISADGQSASYELDLSAPFDGTGGIPPAFEVVVRAP
jgi:hypothetical protein